MKKITLFLIVITFISCSSHPGRVCGGGGGKRCVEISVKKEHSNKRNS